MLFWLAARRGPELLCAYLAVVGPVGPDWVGGGVGQGPLSVVVWGQAERQPAQAVGAFWGRRPRPAAGFAEVAGLGDCPCSAAAAPQEPPELGEPMALVEEAPPL